MAGISDFLAGELRKHLFRTGTYTKPAALYVSLHTGDPGASGANEVSGGSYARVQRNPSDANWQTVGAKQVSNAAAVTFPAPTGGGWGLVTHVGVWDDAAAGNFLAGGALGTPKTVNGGDAAPSFDAGALVVTFV